MDYGIALAALANPTRRALFERLRRGAQTVGELASAVPVSQPAVSQHLRRLREAGLVEERRAGTRHYFQARLSGLAELRSYLEATWDEVLAAYADPAAPVPANDKESG